MMADSSLLNASRSALRPQSAPKPASNKCLRFIRHTLAADKVAVACRVHISLSVSQFQLVAEATDGIVAEDGFEQAEFRRVPHVLAQQPQVQGAAAAQFPEGAHRRAPVAGLEEREEYGHQVTVEKITMCRQVKICAML